MSLELENRASMAMTSTTSISEANNLLAQSGTDDAKRLIDEARSTLHEKYPNLADMSALDILKVIGNVNTWVYGAQQEITELCISIAFPLFILRCRLLANLLAELSVLDDQGEVPEIAWGPQQQSILGRLDGGFDSNYFWRERWSNVLYRWKSEVEDSPWLSVKVVNMRKDVDSAWSIFIPIEAACSQITVKTVIPFRDITINIRNTFQLFNGQLDECKAKVDELNAKEQSKHLLPPPNAAQGQSWTSGSETPSGGITKRTSFGKGAPASEIQPQPGSRTTGMFQNLRHRAHKGADTFRNANKEHWARLLQLAKSPVLLILMVAMPFTIYSTILYEVPDDLPIVDSNFWSTLSQCISGFAGLYVVTKPMFSRNGRDKIQTAFPKTFYTMLIVSFMTNIVSVVAYSWNPPSSIPLAYVSGLALNIATLLIIQDSGNQIRETNRLNENLELKLARYEGMDQ